MKFLIILLSLNAYALDPTIKARLEAVGAHFGAYSSYSGLYDLAQKCGHNADHEAKYIKSLFRPENSAMITCLEGKYQELLDDRQAEKDKETQKDTDCVTLKSDSSLPAYAKRLLLRLCPK